MVFVFLRAREKERREKIARDLKGRRCLGMISMPGGHACDSIYACNKWERVCTRMLRSIGIDIGRLYLPVETSRLLSCTHTHHACRMPSIHLPSVFGLPCRDAERIANMAI